MRIKNQNNNWTVREILNLLPNFILLYFIFSEKKMNVSEKEDNFYVFRFETLIIFIINVCASKNSDLNV